jgi:hypothetical protein
VADLSYQFSCPLGYVTSKYRFAVLCYEYKMVM